MEIARALDLERISCVGRTMARTIGNPDVWRFGVVLTIITSAITIVFRPEFLLFKAQCLITLGEAVAPGNREMFKASSKHVYPNIWRVYIFKKVGKCQVVFCPGFLL